MRYSEILKRTLPRRKQRYEMLFATEDGRWVLADLARQFGFRHDPHTRGDSHHTEYLVGRGSVISYIQKTINISDEEIEGIIVSQEQIERRALEEEEL